ncbi:MAG: hypothetical protein WCS96_10685 [Victivallales bacterium]
MIRNMSFVFLIFFSISTYAQDTPNENSNSPSIAIGAFLDISGGDAVTASTLREKIIAHLMANCNCLILNRSQGFRVSEEKAIANMDKVINSSGTQRAVLAADMVATGHVQARNSHKETLLFIDGLRQESGKSSKLTIPTDSPSEIAEAIAKQLGFQPKPPTSEHHAAPILLKETWTVLPFTVADAKKTDRTGAELAIRAELALQESGRLAKLVDHNELEKIMTEAKLSLLTFQNQNSAAEIGRIAHADKAILGLLSTDAGQSRLDMFLVDVETTAIIAVESAKIPADAVSDTAAALAVKFLARTWSKPKLSVCDSKKAVRELNVYLKTLELTSQNKESFDTRLLYAIVQCEAAFLLAGNDQGSLRAIGHRINYDDGKWISMSGPLKDYAVYLADQVYGKLQQSTKQTYYLNRITARIKAGRYAEALQMIEEYERKGMREDEKDKDAMKAGLLFYFKRYDEALAAAEKSDDHYWCIYSYAPSGLIVDIKKKLAGESSDPDSGLKAEYEKLEKERVGKLKGGIFNDFQRWAFLARKFEKPESVLKKMLEWKTLDIGSPDAQIELAKAYIDTGEKEKAGRIIGRLSSVPLFNTKYVAKAPATRFKELTSEGITPIPEQWATLGKIIPQKKAFKLYLRPIGRVDKAFAEKTSRILGDFLDMEVGILPAANLPEESESYSRERRGYRIEWLWKSSMNSSTIPQDAVSLILLTEENLVDGLWTDFFMFRTEIGGAVSYKALKGGWNTEESVAKVAASIFLVQCNNVMNGVNQEIFQKINIPPWGMSLGACSNYPCLMSCCRISQEKDFPRRKFALCEDCQKRFAKIDLDRICNSFQKEIGKYRRELERNNNK